MEFVQNQYVQVIATLAALLSAPLVVFQIIKDLLQPIGNGIGNTRRKSREHLETITEISKKNEAYMSACVLILIVRILASFFCVTFALLMVIASFFLHMSNASNPILDVFSITILIFSSILLVGTLNSAKKFSEAVRERIAPNSMKGRTWL